MHDILKAAFPELQLIFLYYCGSSIAGSGSMSSATRIGLQVRVRVRVRARIRVRVRARVRFPYSLRRPAATDPVFRSRFPFPS